MSLLPLNIAGLGILGFLESVSPDIFGVFVIFNSSSDFSVLGESGGGSCVSGFVSECSDFGDSRTDSGLSDFSDLGESGGGSTGLLKGFGPATDGNGTWLVEGNVPGRSAEKDSSRTSCSATSVSEPLGSVVVKGLKLSVREAL